MGSSGEDKSEISVNEQSSMMRNIWMWAIAVLVTTVNSKTTSHVTCGSVFKLVNTYYEVRLHSHDIKYGSGSGQQSVTGVESKTDVNSHWAIEGKSISDPCQRGEVVSCGQEVRLQHQSTKKNLHSHHFSSPLSNQQEVSAFGDEGEGDSGDVWKVICSGDAWARSEPVGLKHVDTGVFLGASGRTFGRPIHGQMEIVGLNGPSSTTQWKAAEGIFVHQSNFDPTSGRSNVGPDHDEL